MTQPFGLEVARQRRIARRTLLAAPALLALPSAGIARAAPAASVVFHAGWSIVAGPTGTRFAGASGPLYALGPEDDDYVVLPAGTPSVAGAGYWAYFPTGRTLALAAGDDYRAIAVPAQKWVLIGNPSGALTLPVIGADAVFTFDPLLGSRYTGQLLPGQGAWAISLAGGTMSLGLPPS